MNPICSHICLDLVNVLYTKGKKVFTDTFPFDITLLYTIFFKQIT